MCKPKAKREGIRGRNSSGKKYSRNEVIRGRNNSEKKAFREAFWRVWVRWIRSPLLRRAQLGREFCTPSPDTAAWLLGSSSQRQEGERWRSRAGTRRGAGSRDKELGQDIGTGSRDKELGQDNGKSRGAASRDKERGAASREKEPGQDPGTRILSRTPGQGSRKKEPGQHPRTGCRDKDTRTRIPGQGAALT